MPRVWRSEGITVNASDFETPRRLGRSNLTVTPLGFGGGTIGSPAVSNEASLATVAAAWETGVRFFDTAPWYGLGRSERRLGLSLAPLAPRGEYRINTKVGKRLVAEAVRDDANRTLSPNGQVRTPRDHDTGMRVRFAYDADSLQRQHEDSLQRLGTSSVDSLTIHDIDFGYHSPEQIERHLAELSAQGGADYLHSLRDTGTIAAIGCGCNLETRNAGSWDVPTNGAVSPHEELCERIADIVELDFFVVAGGYTLLETRALRRILPLCEERGIGVVIAAPYASGWLANPDGATTYMYDKAPDWVVERSARMSRICAEFDVPLASVALQFVLAHPAVAAAIPGARSPEEPRANRANLDLVVPTELWQRLRSEGLLPDAAPTPER